LSFKNKLYQDTTLTIGEKHLNSLLAECKKYIS